MESAGNRINESRDIQGPTLAVPILSDARLRAFARDIGTAGETKTVRVYYGITQLYHDLVELEVRGIIGKDVTWSRVNSRTAGDITYDPEKREVIWKLNALPGTVKRIDGSFDITVPTSFSSSASVMESVVFSARDRIINVPISQPIEKLTITESQDGL